MKAQPAVPAGYGTLNSTAFGFDETAHAHTLSSDASDPTPKALGDPEPDEPEFHPEDLVPVKVNGDSDEPIDESTPIRFSWRTLWAYTGPGFLMSIAYLDPGNLESDLQAGAQTGYQLIWVLFWATVLGWLFQILSVRLGVITGKDLAQVCRHEYPRPVAMCVWIMTEIAIIGADIQEVVGSAIALNILFGLPLYGGVLITAFDTFTFMFLHYFGVRKLEAFFGFLIALMAMCFAVQFGIGGPDGAGIMKGWIVPTVDKDSLIPAVGMLGAVIMPHNMFLHSALVQSRKVDRTSKRAVREAIMYFTIEAAISLAISFVINMMVVAVFARGFYSSGNPNTDIGLHEAGDQLEAVFGKAARIFWAIGLLAAGQSSTMTGTFAGQYVMQGFLNMRIAQWIRTGITRSVALVPALIVALAATNNMDDLDEYINVLQSIQLPFALLPVLVFNCSTHIMSEDFIIPRKYRYPLAFLVVLVIGTNVYLVVSFMQTNISTSPVAYFLLSIFFLLYCAFLFYLFLRSHAPSRRYWYAFLGGFGRCLGRRGWCGGCADAMLEAELEETKRVETALHEVDPTTPLVA